MKKYILTIALAACAALLASAGCKQAGTEFKAPLDTQNNIRLLCQTVLAETINSSKDAYPKDDETRKVTKECMTESTAGAGGDKITPEQDRDYAKKILTACKEYAGQGQPWLDCYKRQIKK